MKEATAVRQRSWVEREEQLSKAAVDVVASISAHDRAEHSGAKSIGIMLALHVTRTEVGERCGLPVKEVPALESVDDVVQIGDAGAGARRVGGRRPRAQRPK